MNSHAKPSQNSRSGSGSSSGPKSNNGPKNGARYCAARAVQQVLETRIALDQALMGQALYEQLEARDRAFARLIAATTLRRMGQIDKVLAPFVKKEPPAYVQSVLRTGAAQILFLGTPAHAAVGASVALLKRSKKTIRASGMANAVLRRLSEQKDSLLAQTRPLDNIPPWLAKTWQEAYGAQATRSMAQMLAQDPPLDLSLKTANPDLEKPDTESPDTDGSVDVKNWAEKLGATILPTNTLRLDKIGDVRALAGFDEGVWWAQDISASLPVKVLGDIKGKRVLDMCAAPGGKTMQLCAAGADVVAIDKSEARMARVQENLTRTGLAATLIVGDAARWRDEDNTKGGGFDCVVLDAPCSATGVFRRRPDVMYTKSPADVASLMRVQEKLLLSASRHVKVGGDLIYCTCSLQPEEGELQIHKFMKNRANFRLNPILENFVLPHPEIAREDGFLRVLPHYLEENGGMDGFFIARFTRC